MRWGTGILALRVVAALFVLALVALLDALPAGAATTGGWTLNITNTGYNPIPAGATLPYTVRIDNNDNVATPATTITFAIPATTELLGIDGFDNCGPVPLPTAGPANATCDVPVLAPSGVMSGTVRLRPLSEGRVTLTGTIPNPGPSFSRQTTVERGTDLAVAMSATPATVKAGSIAGFSAVVSNVGLYEADGASLVLTIPAGLSSTVSMPAGCAAAASTITCTISNALAVGASMQFDFSAQVTAASASTITVAGQVSPTSPRDGITTNNSGTADIIVTPGTDVSIGKTRAPQGLILVGDSVTFTLQPRFVGTAPALASVVDTLPTNYSVVSVTPTAGSGWTCPAPSGQTVQCSYSAAAGTAFSAPITVRATAVSATSGAVGVTNTATISSVNENADAGANNTGNDGAAFIAEPVIDLVALKTGPPRGLVTVGNSYAFALRTRNDGNAGFSGPLTITDHLPAGLRMTAIALPAGWSCATTPPVDGPADVDCTTSVYTPAAPLAAGAESGQIVLTAQVTAAGSSANGMTVSFRNWNAGADVAPANNTISTGFTSADGANWADVSLTKTSPTASPVQSGDLMTFDIELINAGPAAALNVVLDDRLNDIVASAAGGTAGAGDVNLSANAGVASGMSCGTTSSSAYARDLQCTISSLPVCVAGSTCPKLTVTVRTGGQGTKTNTATAFSLTTPDNTTANNTSSVSYTVDTRTDVTVTKTSPAAAAGVRAGQELIYVLTASVPGNGLASADDVTVTDTLPLGLVFKSAVPSSGACAVTPTAESTTAAGNRTLTCNLGTIANGSQQTVTVKAIPVTSLANTSISNSVDVTTTTAEPDQSNNSAQLSVNVLPPQLDLIISKTDSPDPVAVETDTVYTITARNSGPSGAFNVRIVDTLPPSGLADPRIQSAPAGATCALSGHSATVPGGTLTCDIPYLAANASVQVTLAMKGIARGRHTNMVAIMSDETVAGFESPTDNNTSYEDTTVRERVDLVVTKVPSVATVDLREEFSWTVTVTNTAGAGLGVAEWVKLADTLPAGMELTRVPVASTGTCTGVVGTRAVSCELGDMAAGAVATVTLWTKITSTSAGAMLNSATATTLSFEQTPANNTGTGSVSTVLGSSISGTLYRDFNANDVKDTGDTGISGITMTVTGTAVHDGATITASTTTNSSGNYSFGNLPPGTYSVRYGTIAEQHLSNGKALPGPNDPPTADPVANGVNRIDGIVITTVFAATHQDFTRVPVARIGIGKVAGTPTVLADGSFTIPYTLTVTNLSLEPVTGITVTDTLNGPTQNFGTYSGGGAPGDGQYRISVAPTASFGTAASGFNGADATALVSNGTLAAGASGTVSYTVHVRTAAPRVVPIPTLTNQASISGTGQLSGQLVSDLSNNTASPDPDGNGIANETANNTPTTVTPAFAGAVTLVKTATTAFGAGGAVVGDRITYSFTVTNTGNTPLFNVLVTDPLPGLTGLSATPITRLDPGQSDSTSFAASYLLTQADLDAGRRTNTASVSGQWGVTNGTPVTATASATQTVTALNRPGLSIVKSVAPALSSPPKPGDAIAYTFLVTNTGNQTLRNVVVTDALPGLTMTSAFSFPSLLPGAANAVRVTATYALRRSDIDDGEVRNSAMASFDTPLGAHMRVTSNEVVVPVAQVAALAVVKSASVAKIDPAVPGDVITYSFSVTNTGNMDLVDVAVNDPLPGLTPNTFAVPSLAAGATAGPFTATYAISAADITSGRVRNQATATANFDNGVALVAVTDLSGTTLDSDAPTVVALTPETPALRLTKTGAIEDSNGDGVTGPGDLIRYRFTVENTGNVPLRDTTPSDAGPTFDGRPAGNVLSSMSPAPVTLQPGQTQQFIATYALTADDINAATGIADGIVNTASARGFAIGTLVNGQQVDSNQSTARLTLAAAAPGAVSVTKRAETPRIQRGGLVFYTIAVSNAASASAGLVDVTDTIPAGFRYVEGTATVGGAAVTPKVSGRTVVFEKLVLGGKTTVALRLRLQALASTGPGRYLNHVAVTDRTGRQLATAQAPVEIKAEAVLDCAELIGRVFDDTNNNGTMEKGESGIAGVRLATVNGEVITTDAHGRYSVPCVALPNQRIGSNVLLKLDERTLPTGYSLTTPNPEAIRLTAGKMSRINFGASIGRMVAIELSDAAFAGREEDPGEVLRQSLAQLAEQIADRRSTVNFTYHEGKAGRALASQRLQRVEQLLQEAWRKQGAPYELVVTSRVVEGE